MADKPLPATEDLIKRNLELHVICNSHLDREWTEPYQFTRMLTVRFIDSLLRIMADDPEYQFLLDSQTVPLEDYLEIRPEHESSLREYVRAERLWVGPWYTAPDFSCVFGESIVRNLLIGHRIGRDYGKVMKVGYTPFGFGQVSQLPQIYAGFGIDMIWFYRGVNEREVPGICFRWTGADGTTAFCSRANRYNFYFGVVRPIAKGGGVMERDYDYASTQLPVHFCDRQRRLEHAMLADSQTGDDLSVVRDHIIELLRDNTRFFPGSVISFMNGMDTSMPSKLDSAVIERAKADLPGNWRIFHSNLPAFVAAFRGEIERERIDIPTVHGERRDAGKPSPDTTMLGDILTARPVQKRRNAKAEVRLQRYAEPLVSLAWLLGTEYPSRFLEQAWKTLCRCHPHDTIAGAGVDQIERDMLNRLDQVIQLSEGLMQFAMGDILRHVSLGELDETDIPLVVFNPSARSRSETVQAGVDLPHAFEFEGFELLDGESGKAVEYAITAWDPNGERVVRDCQDCPTSFYCAHVDIDFVADNVPPLGYRTFILRNAVRRGYCKSLFSGPQTLENEHLRVSVEADGTLTLTEKLSGRTYRGLNRFRDRGEAGNAWVSEAPTVDRVVLSMGESLRVSVTHDSPLRGQLKVEQVMRVPADLVANPDHSFTRRSRDEVEIGIISYVTLVRGGRAVDIRTVIENTARNHTLQVIFPSGGQARVSSSDTAFDVVSRGILRDEDHSYAQTLAPTYPCLRFVHVADDHDGLAVANVGVRGYQVTEDDDRAIVLTLIRAFEVNMCTVSYRWERRPDQLLSQAPGRHEIEYSIIPHVLDWRGRVIDEAERLNVPMLIAQTGRHDGTLPLAQSFIGVESSAVELSAVKKTEEGDALLIRLFNPTDGGQDTTLTFFREVAEARLLTLEERPMDGEAPRIAERRIYLHVGPKKVVTVEVRLA